MAFFKGKFYQNPAYRPENKWSITGNFQVDQCDPAGCLYELAVQLGVIMVGKQFFNNCLEFIIPLVSFLVLADFKILIGWPWGHSTTMSTKFDPILNLFPPRVDNCG